MFWEYNEYLGPDEESPLLFVSPSSILSQASRLTVKRPVEREDDNEESEDEDVLPELMWVTCGLTKVCCFQYSRSLHAHILI